ncbi:hypothetical protein GCM10027456_38760 [Kineosporia babensis]
MPSSPQPQQPAGAGARDLSGRDVVVVGGTGNVGFFLVEGFARAGARVLVPSRSPQKAERLLARLSPEHRQSVVTFTGDIGTPEGAAGVQAQVRRLSEGLQAVAAAPAGWHQTPSMLQSGFGDFKAVMENSLYPHYLAAQTLLPMLSPDGSYTSINGPVGSMGAPGPGMGPMAVVSVAQNKLMQAIGVETGGRPRVNDLIMVAFLGPQGTRPGSRITGEQVGEYVAALAGPAGAAVHGQTLRLHEPAQIEAATGGDFSSY